MRSGSVAVLVDVEVDILTSFRWFLRLHIVGRNCSTGGISSSVGSDRILMFRAGRWSSAPACGVAKRATAPSACILVMELIKKLIRGQKNA
jgi:hypothetical protein